jgi:hypothetical protein
VHGSWVRAAFHTVQTSWTGRLLEIFFHAIDPHRAIITEGCTAPLCCPLHPTSTGGRRHVLTEGADPFQVENVRVVLARKALTVTTGRWSTTSASTVGPPHVGKLRMNIEIKPTYAVD